MSWPGGFLHTFWYGIPGTTRSWNLKLDFYWGMLKWWKPPVKIDFYDFLLMFKNYANEDQSKIDFLSWGAHSMCDISFEPQWPGKLVSEEILELALPGGDIFMLLWKFDEKKPFFSGFFKISLVSFACGLMRLDVHVQTNIMQSPTASVNKDPLFSTHNLFIQFLRNP